MIDHSLPSEAISLMMGDRYRTHGDPAETLTRIAGLWQSFLGTPITAADVAKMMTLVKIARSRANYDRDHFVDAISYLLLAESLDR